MTMNPPAEQQHRQWWPEADQDRDQERPACIPYPATCQPIAVAQYTNRAQILTPSRSAMQQLLGSASFAPVPVPFATPASIPQMSTALQQRILVPAPRVITPQAQALPVVRRILVPTPRVSPVSLVPQQQQQQQQHQMQQLQMRRQQQQQQQCQQMQQQQQQQYEEQQLRQPQQLQQQQQQRYQQRQDSAVQPQACTYAVSVYLLDDSRDLLLSVMQPLHAHAHCMPMLLLPAVPVERVCDFDLPWGVELTLDITGVVADGRAQVLSTSCQAVPGLPPCHSAYPHIILSLAAGATAQDAEALIVEGVCRQRPGYVPLSEPLPLPARLGAVLIGGQGPVHFSLDSLLEHHSARTAAQAQPPPSSPATIIPYTTPAGQPPSTPATAGQHFTSTPAALALSPVFPVQPAAAQPPADTSQPPVCITETQPVAAVSGPSLLPNASEKLLATGAEYEFELFMQQDARLLPMGDNASPDEDAPPPLLQPELWAASTHTHTQQGKPTRVTQLREVTVGDLVLLVPLGLVGQQEEHEAVQGVVAELLVDDPLQPQGVLVRLEDDVMGHVALVMARQVKQAQEAWPTLGGPPAKGLQAAKPVPSTRLLDEDAKTASRGSSASGGTARPIGGIKVMRKANKIGAQKGTVKKQGGGQASRGSAGASGDEGGGEEAKAIELLEEWQAVQRLFGEAICEAVLADCNHQLAEAVQIMQDQTRLPELLGAIVARSMVRLEQQAMAEVEAERAAAVASATERRRGWAPRPGSEVQWVGTSTKRAPLGTGGPAFPPLSPNSVGYKSGSGAGQGRFTEAVGSGGVQLKLMRNQSSLALLATKAGLNVKDAEALSQLFPGWNPRQAVRLLELANGDVTAAVEELRAMGVAPGPVGPGDMDFYDYAAAAYGLEELAVQEEEVLPPSHRTSNSNMALDSAPSPVSVPTTWQDKVQHLVAAFQGLEPSMAEFALRTCGGALNTASSMLQESMHAHAHNDARAEADSLSLAAALAATDGSYAAAAAPQWGSFEGRVSGPGTTPGTPKGTSTPPFNIFAAPISPLDVGSKRTSQPGGWQVVTNDRPGGGPKARVVDKYGRMVDPLKVRLQSSAATARHKAQILFDARNAFFSMASSAYNAGDGKQAANFSKMAKEFGEEAKRWRTQANSQAYKASNFGVRNEFTMDLHGLFVEEAIDKLAKQVDALQRLQSAEGVLLKVITGQGHHSAPGKVAAIKAAVKEWATEKRLKHFMEPGNEGVVVIHCLCDQ